MARRTKEDAEKTKESLLDAAEAVFLKKGVAAASLEEIARTAGVTRGAVYWHFDNKCDIFKAMHARVKLPLDQMLEQAATHPNALQALQNLCIYTIRNFAEDERTRRVFTILMFKCDVSEPLQVSMEYQNKRRQEVLSYFSKAFQQAYAKGELAEGITPDEAALSLHCYMSGIFRDYLRDPSVMQITSLAPLLVGIFFKGIKKS